MKRHIRLFLTAVVIGALLIGAAACGGGEEAAGIITAGTDTSFVPFEYEENGEYTGFDIDLLKEIAERAGFEYELMPMDFKGIIPALQTGDVDIALAAMTITEERKEFVDFSIPYYEAGLLMMVKADEENIKGIEDLEDKVVATKLGTTSADFCDGIAGLKDTKLYDNIEGAYFELQNGGADAVIFDSPAILYYIKTDGQGKVKTVGPLYEGQQYGIAFPKDSELREKVDEALQSVFDDGTYDEIFGKWFGRKPQNN